MKNLLCQQFPLYFLIQNRIIILKNACSYFERSYAMKEEYITTIINILQKCEDIELLDFILQLLQKSR